MDTPKLKEKEDLIQLVSQSYNIQDILSISRNLEIETIDFYAEGGF